MNQGGEPGHDDYGLPPVDIRIPDDARELYRDVQAYHRELRALRRHERSRRWRAPLRRTGLVLPLIAGCLVAAMIASMVLTMFSANPYFSGIAGQNPGRATGGPGHAGTASGIATPAGTATGPASPAPSAAGQATAGAGQTAGPPLPAATIVAAGKPVLLSHLTSAALAIVPATCGCSAGTAIIATDAADVLQATYRPAGLTVLLVDSRGSVVSTRFQAGINLEPQFRSLKPAA